MPRWCTVMASEDRVPVYIRRELYEKAKKFVEEQGGFRNVEELVEFLIEEATELEGETEVLSKEEEEKIKERLRDLGYL